MARCDFQWEYMRDIACMECSSLVAVRAYKCMSLFALLGGWGGGVGEGGSSMERSAHR